MNATDLCYAPASELLTLMRRKALSPVEVCRAFLERIERVNSKLNAFCTMTADTALDGLLSVLTLSDRDAYAHAYRVAALSASVGIAL